MEGEKSNSSTFYTPGVMSDMTLVSTPLPQAASTATKRHSVMDEDEFDHLSRQTREFNKKIEAFCQSSSTSNRNFVEPKYGPTSSGLKSTRIPQLTEMRERPTKPDEVDPETIFSKGNNFKIPSEQLELPFGLSKYSTMGNLVQLRGDRLSSASLTQHQGDRVSVASSANSSLGVIPSEVIDEVSREPLVDVNQDLSLRLAQQLNLDTSLIKDGMDISLLAHERLKEKVAAKSKDKENQRISGRSSSDYWTLHGYSSDNSDSRNNTAKRLSALSTGSGGESDTSRKLTASPRRSLRPLSEFNFSSQSNSRSGRFSVGSNPFGSYSNVSVSSEDFQFAEDAAQRLERDERQFSMASSRSLSGIYGGANVSVNVNGEKLSMSSFLRSGSYPLGSLESGCSDSQSPQFGMPAKSPEKKGRPKAILPLPLDKSTFVMEEEPVRDTPWAPHSLMEQYSSIHNTNTDVTDADTSVPSLSYIGELLEKLHQGANPTEIYAQLMASQEKIENKTNESTKPSKISSIVEGENSFCQGIRAERSLAAADKSSLQHTSTEAPLDESVCNITDFEGDEDACVCVMTPQSMDFEIFHELPHPAEYSFAKACYVEGVRKDSSAYVHFPASKMMMYPGQKRTLTINIAALVEGVIKIKIEIVRKNPLTQTRESSFVYGKIVAEIPRVFLMTPHEVEMSPGPDCGRDGTYRHTIVMKNEGRSTVPLKLTVAKVSDDDVYFHFGEWEKQSITLSLEPGQILRQQVRCVPPPVFALSEPPGTIIPTRARVEFSLASTDLYQLSPISPVSLVAPLKPYFFGAPPSLAVPSVLSLYNTSTRPLAFRTAVEFGFTLDPSSFIIPPRTNVPFEVTVGTTDMKNPMRHGDLTLRVDYPVGQQSYFTIQLQELPSMSPSLNSSLATPHSSRPTSPTSPSGNVRAPVGELRVACSLDQLAWGGCPLHQRVVKTFCLKNMGRQREKLRLTMSDSCFKILVEEDTLKSEFKLSLQPMENREIKVAVLATETGPQWGHLTVSRISCAADKNVLPLSAVGGKPKMNMTEGIIELEGNKYLFLDENTLQGTFALANSGDNVAFFRICEANSKSCAGLSIAPQEGLLMAGRTVTVDVSLSVTAKRLESLLRQPQPSVCVAQLSIRWGDESTRQRLLRARGLHGVLAARVSQLSHISSCAIPNLDRLHVSASTAEGLWEEDTDEWTVGVFVKRTALEALRLDTSDDFVDLSKTISKPQL